MSLNIKRDIGWLFSVTFFLFSKYVTKQEIQVIADLNIEEKARQYKFAWE